MKQYFKTFYLDKEKDIIVDLYKEDKILWYVLRTPNHKTGNLIRNLSKLCKLPLNQDENGLLVIEGQVPCYVDGYNRSIYIFRLGNTKVANIYMDGTIEMKAHIPSISKTLMSQTKDYKLDVAHTIVKTYIRSECKFHTDLHTHMNANLKPDILIALGIYHQIQYPLYYIKKLKLRVSTQQEEILKKRREKIVAENKDCPLTGKYLTRRIDDRTFINFADLILNNIENAKYNISKIRMSLSVLKDGQAVFTNLEKVYLYRYVFTKGVTSKDTMKLKNIEAIPDLDIQNALTQMLKDQQDERYKKNSLFQDKLLWIARSYREQGVNYAEISDTTLVKRHGASQMLKEIHEVMPFIMEETGVCLRFLAAIRRIPLTIVKNNIKQDYFWENLQVLDAIAMDPYVAGSDILGEEINDIREIQGVIKEIVQIAKQNPAFVIRIHAGENDSLRDNVYNSIQCVKQALDENQAMPRIRIGHGLYTANLKSKKGLALIHEIQETKAVLEFQISSNVRLNNLSTLEKHPLKEYLKNGLYCVQGSDGGALYGTDSIDEQLSLEKLLDLSLEELCQMRKSEDIVYQESMQDFNVSYHQFHVEDVQVYYQNRIENRIQEEMEPLLMDTRLDTNKVFETVSMPLDKLPIVVMGGSFNSDQHKTKMHKDIKEMIDAILEAMDPNSAFFVIGHKLTGYEKYLVKKNNGKFKIVSIVPARITKQEFRRLKKANVSIVPSIESISMGLYKSFAYEIFKRRTSILLALDGNSAGANMIQEAKNSQHECRIYVSEHSRILKAKAESLDGYVTILKNEIDWNKIKFH